MVLMYVVSPSLTEVGKLWTGQPLVGDGLQPVGGELGEADEEAGQAGQVDGALQGPGREVPLVERHVATISKVF